jgi:hypothetical protein
MTSTRQLQRLGSGIAKTLRSRHGEIELTIATRLRNAIPDHVGHPDAAYAEGWADAIAATVDYCLVSIERGEDAPSPIPSVTVAQAHRAVHLGSSLGPVLRGCVLIHTTLGELIMEEAGGSFPTGKGAALSQRLYRIQASQLECLTASLANEYSRELERAQRSPEQHRAALVRRLLAGGRADSIELGYELDAWHLGMIAIGPGSGSTVRDAALALDLTLLPVAQGDQTIWAWLGGPARLTTIDVRHHFSSQLPSGLSLAIGEPGKGLDGWRFTHQQAQAALRVALREPARPTLLADVLLAASLLGDEISARSLHEIFLAPLSARRDADVLRSTLRAYFAARCNAATAAAALEVDRHTVERRLHRIEKMLGRLPQTCQAELEVALRLDELAPI